MAYIGVICWTTFIICLLCLFINNAQHTATKNTIEFLKDTVRSTLLLNGEPRKARLITLNEIPKLQGWYEQSLNYGLINILGVGATFWLLISHLFLHSFSFFTILFAAMFFGSNMMFLPRAATRHVQVVNIMAQHIMLLNTLELLSETGVKDKKKDETGTVDP